MARWITVANRLPFSLSSDGRRVTTSSGGLVSALSGVKTKDERIWVGVAPDGLTPEAWPLIEKSLASGPSSWKYKPVFTEPELYDAYYNKVCNDVFWPILHYQGELVSFDAESWKSYREMNQRFANEIASIAREDDLIWIHDFHLFLLPKMLKALRPELRVGFFLHVPFPSSEVFRQLPVREEILDSLLEADLVGFHDYSYLQHFSSSVLRLLGIESEFLSINRGGRVTRMGVFPVSIDTDHFIKRTKDAKVRTMAKEMERENFVFLGVDRLDYMKGLDLKLRGFRTLLRMFPEFREKVSLLQVAVPTRQGVPVYNKLAREVARLIGEINGEFSTPNWSPIHYIHNSVSNDKLIALYRAADALLVSSKRDGMNLVALEYIASQEADCPGVVLLSEFAGAISTLSHAIPINPWDLEDTARKMKLAMEMPRQEKVRRQQTMQTYLRNYTATDWASLFISELEKQEPSKRLGGPPVIEVQSKDIVAIRDQILEKNPKQVALFVDYDGTLVPIQPSPELAILSPQTKRELRQICKYPWLKVAVVSGRDSRFLSTQLADLPLALAAEHGAKSLDPAVGRWQRNVHRNRNIWYPSALKIISDYTARVPHSHVEKKHYSIAWHYRQAPKEYAAFQALKLAEELETGLANLPVSVLRGKKVIEVRAVEAEKGVFANSVLDSNENAEIVAIAIGDDRTDEDMFRAIQGRGLSIKVGSGPSVANFALHSQSDTMPFLLKLLASLDEKLKAPARGSKSTRESAAASSSRLLS